MPLETDMSKKKIPEWRKTAKLLLWAAKLHIARWSAYRMNVVVWVFTIWCTIAIQVLFGALAYQASGENIFGNDGHTLVVFLGMTLLATGIAQSIVHGVVLHLGRCVWTGQFDYWLIQPPGIVVRLFLEDMGLVWFIPHIFVGAGILVWQLSAWLAAWAILIAIISAVVEIGVVLCICIPAIRWGRWDPSAGLWEYFDRARTIPILRSGNLLLMIISAGVLHYSVALEVYKGSFSILILLAMAVAANVGAMYLLKNMVRSYSSASS